jgi:hypothetical protein
LLPGEVNVWIQFGTFYQDRVKLGLPRVAVKAIPVSGKVGNAFARCKFRRLKNCLTKEPLHWTNHNTKHQFAINLVQGSKLVTQKPPWHFY